MRFALVSDIHANLQAWNAVLVDIRCNGVDKIVCLGDIVGYGPNPAEVLKSVHANVDYLVLGNHDAVVCGKMDADLFNDDAREIIHWTREHLNSDAVKFLRSLPLSLAAQSFRCAHGDFSHPAAFNYIIDPEDALPSWQRRDDQLLFVGHSHMPAIFLLGHSGTPHVVKPQDFVLEEDKRYLVNVGSVGQPRDGEPRASYCIYDTSDLSVIWKRIPFDIEAYRSALAAAGLSEKPSYFLRHDPLKGTPPIRHLLNFSPPESPDKAVQDTVDVQEVETLQRRVAKWKLMTLGVMLAGLLGSAGGGALWWRQAHRAAIIIPPHLPAIPASAVDHSGGSAQRDPIPDHSNLLAVPVQSSGPHVPIDGWEVHLGDRRKQQVSVEQGPEGLPVFVLQSSGESDELTVTSRTIRARQGDRFRLYAELQIDTNGTGKPAVFVDIVSDGKPVQYEWQRIPFDVEKNGWLVARKVFPESNQSLPGAGSEIRIEIRGRFTGQVRVRRLGLGRVDTSDS